MTNTNGILVAHCGARRMSRAELAEIPAPESRGPRHAPIPHALLVETLTGVLAESGLTIQREEFATYKDGATLFGVMDLAPNPGLSGFAREGMGFSMGLRGANDRSMSLQIAVGTRVFVCDNLCFSGDLIALRRKHTTGLALESELREAIGRYQEQSVALVGNLNRAREHSLTDTAAKVLMFDQFRAGVLPAAKLPAVAGWYFDPPADATDCQGRTLLALHNAFTRECRDLKPARRFEATATLGRLLV